MLKINVYMICCFVVYFLLHQPRHPTISNILFNPFSFHQVLRRKWRKNKKPRLFLFHFSSPSGVFKYSKWKTTNIMKSQAEKHFMKVDDKFRNAPSCKKQCIKKKILWKRSRSSSRNESKIKSLLPKFRIQMKKKICLKFSQL